MRPGASGLRADGAYSSLNLRESMFLARALHSTGQEHGPVPGDTRPGMIQPSRR